MHMSETTSIIEQAVEHTGVIELGSASDMTRGSTFTIALLDGHLAWPLIFAYSY
jgi:hypothetical protein